MRLSWRAGAGRRAERGEMGNSEIAMALRHLAEKELPLANKRYESEDSRVRALYEMPLSAQPRRVLEVVMGAAPALPRVGWGSPVLVHDLLAADDGGRRSRGDGPSDWANRQLLPFGDETIDLVVIHNTLDSIAGRLARRDSRAYACKLLREINRVLHPQGIIAGCAANRSARLLRGKAVDGAALTSAAGYRSLLGQAGFHRVNLFHVLPDPNAPQSVLSLAPDAIRDIGRIKLHARRGQLSWLGYALRRIATELTLDRWLADSLFFYSSKR